ncbi:MAG: hypothetical protein ACYC99_13155 [Candidatus Geothermincolia bacterium]
MAAILVPVALIVVVVTLSLLFLTGIVKLGTPSATAISLASRTGPSNKPLDARTRFTASDPDVYCCASVRAFDGTVLESRWYQAGEQVSVFKSTFGKMAGSPSTKFMTTRGRVAFRLERPDGGWAGGPYSVKVFVDGKMAGQRDFMISASEPGGMTGSRYADPAGGFSIVVPEGWLAADKASLGGALAGFLAPAGQSPYPPRFAVCLTDYTSVDINYLNGIITPAGAKPGELFGQYAIGNLVGARRTFEWDYTNGSQQYRLRTIQVVVQVADRFYGIDCHSLSQDFASNEPTFNAIINTFK